MRIIPLIIAGAALLYSCDKKAPTAQNIEPVNAPQKDAMTVADTTSANTTLVENTATSATAKPALNPEHGQPYHRCDIAVGAPIDSPPQNAGTPALSAPPTVAPGFNTNPITPAVSSSAAPAEISGQKPAVNPPHGEPYHRCDLQVGAPLI